MEKLIQEFGVNWKLLLAQLINFSVLIWVLGRFVYKPILRALEERKKKIEEGVSFSEQAKKELETVEKTKAEQLRQTEERSVEIIKDAEVSAGKVREKILEGAEKDKEGILASGQVALNQERAKLEQGVYVQAREMLANALSKVLSKDSFNKEEEALMQEAINAAKK